ncbi:hypothetical protein GQ44DRAFT_703220 [Phaeosphaeriaceae sp. PMI808]|nr:hypothetical protein GQ44DRAFT_703220 [Phaeosphaeriaceae sp. PMI808]
MSLCSHTLRKIPLSRALTPRSLLPFLYQTATIQRWKHTVRPDARRTFKSRSSPRGDIPFNEWFKDDDTNSARRPPTQRTTQQTPHRVSTRRSNSVDDVPFEGVSGNTPPVVDETYSTRKTTITSTERAAFEQLYKTFNTQGQGRSKNQSGEHEELDQIADEYWEDDDDKSANAVERAAFDAVLRGPQRSLDMDGEKVGAGDVQESDHLEKARIMAEREEIRLETVRIKNYCQAEYQRVKGLFEAAQTDDELWNVLEREIFEQLRSIDLDRPESMTPPPVRAQGVNWNPSGPVDPASIDKRFLFRNCPRNIIKALVVLRENFPASTLPFSIVPTIKAIGRAPYALCITTILYKQLIRTAWIQQSSYTLIDELLSEMDANVISFDFGILTLLDSIITEHEQARGGSFGREMQMVSNMDLHMEGITKIRAWRNFVADKLGIQVHRKQKK